MSKEECCVELDSPSAELTLIHNVEEEIYHCVELNEGKKTAVQGVNQHIGSTTGLSVVPTQEELE